MEISKEWDAAAYQTLSEPQLAWGLRVLERLELRGDEAALDIGCGTGRVTAELAARLPRGRVTAVDLSEGMVAEARRTLGPTLGDRVSFRALDALALDYREQFDLVFSTATFHWVLDHDRLFSLVFRALKPGGRLVAQCGGQGNVERPFALALAMAKREPFAPYFPTDPRHWLYAGPGETAERLSAAGFTEVRTSLEEAPTRFPDAGVFRAFVERIVVRGFLAALPEGELRTRFVDEVVNDAAARAPPYTLHYRRLNLEARRPA